MIPTVEWKVKFEEAMNRVILLLLRLTNEHNNNTCNYECIP
jgi:hypothetical protein